MRSKENRLIRRASLMKMATTTGDFSAYTSSQKESMTYIREAGFRYVDYNFGMDYKNRTGVYSTDWRGYLENVKEHAKDLGLTFVQSHAPMGRPIAEDNRAFVEDTKRCIESCSILGIKNIVVHSGYLPEISKAECFEKNKVFYNELLAFAEPFGVNILVENFNKMCIDNMYWIDNAAELRELIDYVNHPLFHACWDTGHGNMQETPQHEALRILGEHVYAVHVQDNFGNDDSHMAPLCGTLNIDSLMHGLKEINYKGYFTFEAGRMFLPAEGKRTFDGEARILQAPLALRIKAEALLCEIGKSILNAYECLEV